MRYVENFSVVIWVTLISETADLAVLSSRYFLLLGAILTIVLADCPVPFSFLDPSTSNATGEISPVNYGCCNECSSYAPSRHFTELQHDSNSNRSFVTVEMLLF